VRMPAVVLGGAVNALSVARSLWRLGVAVDMLADGRVESVTRHSRACRRYVKPPRGEELADAWMKWLRAETPPSALLPCSDEGVEFIAGRRADLEAAGHRPIEANDEALMDMLDKRRTYEIAREIGVAAPDTVTVASMQDLETLEFPFPCAIKPIHSHRFARRFNTGTKAIMAADAAQARRVLAPIIDAGQAMLLTEVIPGADDQYRSYYSYIDERGEPLLNFTKRKLRQYPTHFGLGSYHLTEWNQEVAELGLRFARGAGLRGVVNVEFKRDARDGELKLIECNPRFTAVTEQLRAAGIDLARVAYSKLAGMPLPPVASFRDHVGMWFVMDDLRALREYREQGELTSLEWLRTLLHRQAPLMFSWRDPRPSAIGWGRAAIALTRKVARLGRHSQRAADDSSHPSGV
jgi:D-aspartate ligase